MSRPRTSRPRSRFHAAVGARIKERREQLKLRQEQVAAELGTDTGMISRYEGGVIPCSTEVLAQLGKVLGCEPGDFVNGIKAK